MEYSFVGNQNQTGPTGSGWATNSETHYLYDGWRVIQERDGSNTPLVSYTRGSDLSGSLEGAGGIGGLLARSHGYSGGNWSTHNFYHADGNGNITYLVNSNQALAASYRYDPYGNTISSSGTLATANVYRFSSKEIHVNSGLYYYGYRWYAPNLQRWLNRDPLGERGGSNLYAFVANDPINSLDPLGLSILIKVPLTFNYAGIQSITPTGRVCGNGKPEKLITFVYKSGGIPGIIGPGTITTTAAYCACDPIPPTPSKIVRWIILYTIF